MALVQVNGVHLCGVTSVWKLLAGIGVVRTSPRLLGSDWCTTSYTRRLVWIGVTVLGGIRRIGGHHSRVCNNWSRKVFPEIVPNKTTFELGTRDSHMGIWVLNADAFIHV